MVINNDNFSEALSKRSAVVFWAEWCSSCKGYKPVVEKAAHELNIDYHTCDVDSNYEFAKDLNIMSLPTTILFHEGKEQKRIVGAHGLSRVKEQLE